MTCCFFYNGLNNTTPPPKEYFIPLFAVQTALFDYSKLFIDFALYLRDDDIINVKQYDKLIIIL